MLQSSMQFMWQPFWFTRPVTLSSAGGPRSSIQPLLVAKDWWSSMFGGISFQNAAQALDANCTAWSKTDVAFFAQFVGNTDAWPSFTDQANQQCFPLPQVNLGTLAEKFSVLNREELTAYSSQVRSAIEDARRAAEERRRLEDAEQQRLIEEASKKSWNPQQCAKHCHRVCNAADAKMLEYTKVPEQTFNLTSLTPVTTHITSITNSLAKFSANKELPLHLRKVPVSAKKTLLVVTIVKAYGHTYLAAIKSGNPVQGHKLFSDLWKTPELQELRTGDAELQDVWSNGKWIPVYQSRTEEAFIYRKMLTDKMPKRVMPRLLLFVKSKRSLYAQNLCIDESRAAARLFNELFDSLIMELKEITYIRDFKAAMSALLEPFLPELQPQLERPAPQADAALSLADMDVDDSDSDSDGGIPGDGSARRVRQRTGDGPDDALAFVPEETTRGLRHCGAIVFTDLFQDAERNESLDIWNSGERRATVPIMLAFKTHEVPAFGALATLASEVRTTRLKHQTWINRLSEKMAEFRKYSDAATEIQDNLHIDPANTDVSMHQVEKLLALLLTNSDAADPSGVEVSPPEEVAAGQPSAASAVAASALPSRDLRLRVVSAAVPAGPPAAAAAAPAQADATDAATFWSPLTVVDKVLDDYAGLPSDIKSDPATKQRIEDLDGQFMTAHDRLLSFVPILLSLATRVANRVALSESDLDTPFEESEVTPILKSTETLEKTLGKLFQVLAPLKHDGASRHLANFTAFKDWCNLSAKLLRSQLGALTSSEPQGDQFEQINAVYVDWEQIDNTLDVKTMIADEIASAVRDKLASDFSFLSVG